MLCLIVNVADTSPESFDTSHLPPSALSAIEADTFWCLSRLLDGIQDNYISQQPGIQRLVKRMGELVKRIDGMSHPFLFSLDSHTRWRKTG
jgi:hypothetical protein